MDAPSKTGPVRDIRGSVITAGLLLAIDGVFYGSLLYSFAVCPIWLLIAIAKAIFRRGDLSLSLKRILFPIITFAILFANASLQIKLARSHAETIIQACTRYHTDKGTYPDKLKDLVPVYLPSVPRAKYALDGNFFYLTYGGQHTLMWVVMPPFGHQDYDFERAKWIYLD